MTTSAMTQYYQNMLTTLTALEKAYTFTKQYHQDDQLVIVEFFLTENNEKKNITLEEIIFHAISGEAHAGNIAFVLHHGEVTNQFHRDEESVSCCKVRHTLGGDPVPAIFNKQSSGEENHYDWCYMDDDNVLHTGVDLEYLLVTFWPSGALFKDAAVMMKKIIRALDGWCPQFHPYKAPLCLALFKDGKKHD